MTGSACAESAERAAGLDLRDLPIVADEDQLASHAADGLRQLDELSGADHGRLVDDEHAPSRQPLRLQAGQQRRDARRGNPRLVLEASCRPPGDRRTDHRRAARFPRLSRSSERVRLAGTGDTDHDRHGVAISGQPADHLRLLARERRSSGDGTLDRLRSRESETGVAALKRSPHEALLRPQERASGVAPLVRQRPHDTAVASLEHGVARAGRLADGEYDRVLGLEKVIRQALEQLHVDRSAGREPLAPSLQHVAARERRARSRQPVPAGQLAMHVEQEISVESRSLAAQASSRTCSTRESEFGRTVAATLRPASPA